MSVDRFQDDPRASELDSRVRSWTKPSQRILWLIFAFETVPATLWCLLPIIPAVQELNGGRFLVGPSIFPFDHTISPYFEVMRSHF
jgi:hypothetical protein